MNFYEWSFRLCSGICHQLPERSLVLFGYQFPLCYRCSGVLAGALIVLALAYYDKLPRPKWALALLLPMVIDILVQMTPWWESVNGWRFATGLGFGIGMPGLILCIFRSS